MYMYKKDLALNSLQWLICHKTKPNRVCPCFSSNVSHVFSLPYYLLIDGARIVGFPKRALSEMQTTLFRI